MKRVKMNLKLKLIIPAVALLLLFSFVLACTANSTATPEDKEYPLEYKLAVIEKGGFVEEDDELVKEFKFLLDNLSKKVINNRQEIADIAVYTKQRLEDEHKIKLSLLKVMKDLDASIPEGIENIKLEEIAAAYIVLIISK